MVDVTSRKYFIEILLVDKEKDGGREEAGGMCMCMRYTCKTRTFKYKTVTKYFRTRIKLPCRAGTVDVYRWRKETTEPKGTSYSTLVDIVVGRSVHLDSDSELWGVGRVFWLPKESKLRTPEGTSKLGPTKRPKEWSVVGDRRKGGKWGVVREGCVKEGVHWSNEDSSWLSPVSKNSR